MIIQKWKQTCYPVTKMNFYAREWKTFFCTRVLRDELCSSIRFDRAIVNWHLLSVNPNPTESHKNTHHTYSHPTPNPPHPTASTNIPHLHTRYGVQYRQTDILFPNYTNCNNYYWHTPIVNIPVIFMMRSIIFLVRDYTLVRSRSSRAHSRREFYTNLNDFSK